MTDQTGRWQRSAAGALVTLALVAAALGCSNKSTQPDTQEQASGIHWVSSAVLYSEAEGKKDVSLLFVLVSWCPHCQNLKSTTLTDSTVIATLNSGFNCVQIDGDSDSLVVYKDSTVTCVEMRSTIYGVTHYPTIIAFDRAGDETSRIVGYKTPEEFVAILNNL